MSISTSVLTDLLQAQPRLRPQIYFKSSLAAVSHAIEDQILAGGSHCLVIASFQQERFFRQEAHRYLQISKKSDQVYILAAAGTGFRTSSGEYETVAFDPGDTLSREWNLVVVGQHYAACLLCQEHQGPSTLAMEPPLVHLDQVRRFEGIWTFDRRVSCEAARLLLQRISHYQTGLTPKVKRAMTQLDDLETSEVDQVNPAPFAERLVTYLQAGQYKLLKTYRSIAVQERKERLVNSITTAIRRSLNPEEILKVAVQELGQALQSCRCLLYRAEDTDTAVTLRYEFLGNRAESLVGQTWLLQDNPLFQALAQQQEPIYVEDTQVEPCLTARPPLKALVQQAKIRSWLLVPVLYQGQLLGVVELHHCLEAARDWDEDERSLVVAIATQVGSALIQAEAYANLEDLNQQLEALERTRSNLIAVTGHELRTPLSTIQVCLESLASEPNMAAELRQVMLSTALTDAERLRKLVQDFLTLSQLESGRVKWHPETLPLQECVDLALSSIHARDSDGSLPQITTQVPAELPLVWADGEWLVEVLSKLIENACKFTDPEGTITVRVERNGGEMVEVTVADTGRGIEPNRLETVFERFYQEEGALRRTTGGTGLGLAICRQIVQGLGGKIWAESAGKDQGTQFHFTLPSVEGVKASAKASSDGSKPPASSDGADNSRIAINFT